jgi:integrase
MAFLHRMFEDAVADELLDSNPCAIKRGELPAKIDKDPTWRSGAVFTREEVERRLISDERVPEDRRLFYAIAFLAGLRTGEVSALRWRAYDSEVNPLGKLLVAASFNTRTRTEKEVKTGRPREAPVHPTLAKLIAAWRLSGWQRSARLRIQTLRWKEATELYYSVYYSRSASTPKHSTSHRFLPKRKVSPTGFEPYFGN